MADLVPRLRTEEVKAQFSGAQAIAETPTSSDRVPRSYGRSASPNQDYRAGHNID